MSDTSKTLFQLIDSPTVRDLRKHLTCGPCVLLDWAVNHQRHLNNSSAFADTHEMLTKRLHALKPYLRHEFLVAETSEIKALFDCYPQLEARLKLITAAIGDGDLKTAIERLVKATGEAWGHKTLPYVAATESAIGQSSSYADIALQPSFMPFLGDARLADFFRTVASNVGWSHPGLLMAGEILAAMNGDLRKADVTVCTKIIFAADHPTHPQGVLADLQIERLPNGCGLLIPDARRCGYLSMEAGFSNGLQNALCAARAYAARNFRDVISQFDWRWSINLQPVAEKLPTDWVQVKLSGRSAEVAVACALIASHGSNTDNVGGIDPLDPHVGTTARLKDPGNADSDLLKGVTEIDVKTLVGTMDTKRLLQVVVASDQDPMWIPYDPRFEFPQAATLKAAYELMTRFPRMTRGVNRYLANKAERFAKERCTPYVLPELAEVLPFTNATSASEATDRMRSLSEEEIRQLVTGQLQQFVGPRVAETDQAPPSSWIGNRVRIFADSGLGKSVFMLHCEATIAKSGQNLLPLRLGRCTGEDGSLAQIVWTGDMQHVIDRLADLPSITRAVDAFATEQPASNWVISSDHRKAWLRWMVKHGRVVFLLDAVDQIDDSINGLGLFLGSGDVSKCPVIITGRLEALAGRKQAWVGNDNWQTLRLKPFDRVRQRIYLGVPLSNELIPTKDQVQWDADENEIRRHQWKDLLEVPLLLSLLKQLATSPKETQSLKSIQSRYELYDRAVTQLITKGWETVENEEQRKLLQSGKRVREVLGIVSWFMVTSHDFTGILHGDDYTAIGNSELLAANGEGSKVLEALQQIDLTTAFQILDDVGASGLSFRHRSFMEFFAGCHFMDRYKAVDKATGRRVDADRVFATERQQILDEIHHTLDDYGQVLPHMLADRANRPADWHDTLRFSLSHAQGSARDELALQLMELGNPWVVAESMKRDGTKFSHHVECLAAWLVHEDGASWFDYKKALDWVHQKSGSDIQKEAAAVIASHKDLLVQMTKRVTRDAACLGTLRQLLPEPQSLYLGLSAEGTLLDQLRHLPCSDGHWNFLESFVNVESGVFDLSEYSEHSEIQPQERAIRAFALADFPVTNAAFEVFCPSHRRRRDQYSQSDDEPAIHVNWHMAREFCEWLSMLTGKTYRLPTEWEREWACRWHNTRTEAYWWGPEMDDRVCWYGGIFVNGPAKETKSTRSRVEAIRALEAAGKWHPSGQSRLQPGLLDMSGNVSEWCENRYREVDDYFGSSRVSRGGSWCSNAVGCRSGFRVYVTPDNRLNYIGFRLCVE